MGQLTNTKTYLCGPMEFTKEGQSWRDVCADRLGSIGVTCFDPYKKPFKEEIKEDTDSQQFMKDSRREGDYQTVHNAMKQIIAADLAMVDRADFIIAHISPFTPTFGTIHEVVVANQAKKPIFIFVDGGVKETPLWMLGLLPPKYFYDNLEDLLDTICKIDSGEIGMDSKRWRLFKEEYR